VAARFRVKLSAPSVQSVSVDFATADGTANSISDYGATSGTLTFAPGVTTQTVTVSVNGDTLYEKNETFFVDLRNPTNATIAVGAGRWTIANDDPLPSLSIADAATTEGNSGTKTLWFTVSLSAASGVTTRVGFATADGTATAGSDYLARSGTLSFAAGTLSKTIGVTINRDRSPEPNEIFLLNLSSPINATISDGQATGTILNDD
jgi:hypothetical protein